MPKIKDVATVMVVLSLFARYWRTDELTYSHLANFPRYGAWLAPPSARKSSPNNFALAHCTYKITAEYFDRLSAIIIPHKNYFSVPLV